MVADNPVRVALPLGIGDCHWVCQKLRGLKAHYGDRPLHAYVNSSISHVTVNYLQLVPFIDKAIQSKKAPYDINAEMPPSYKDPKWSTLEGTRGWQGFDHVLVANGHLELGHRIESFLPEIATDYTYPLTIPEKNWAKVMIAMNAARRVLLYPSGVGPNHGFHQHWWRVKHWAYTIRGLNQAGVVPMLVGAPTDDDRAYTTRILEYNRKQRLRLEFDNIVGLTSTADIMAIIQCASAWAGLNSGLGIVSAMLGTPTVMCWADDRYPVGLVSLHHRMQRSWLSEEQLKYYRTLSYGSEDLTPESLVHNILEVRRT